MDKALDAVFVHECSGVDIKPKLLARLASSHLLYTAVAEVGTIRYNIKDEEQTNEAAVQLYNNATSMRYEVPAPPPSIRIGCIKGASPNVYSDDVAELLIRRISKLPSRFKGVSIVGPQTPTIVLNHARSAELASTVALSNCSSSLTEFNCDLAIAPVAASVILSKLPRLNKASLVLRPQDSTSNIPSILGPKTSNTTASPLPTPEHYQTLGSLPAGITDLSITNPRSPNPQRLAAVINRDAQASIPTPNIKLDLTSSLSPCNKLSSLHLSNIDLSSPLSFNTLTSLTSIKLHNITHPAPSQQSQEQENAILSKHLPQQHSERTTLDLPALIPCSHLQQIDIPGTRILPEHVKLLSQDMHHLRTLQSANMRITSKSSLSEAKHIFIGVRNYEELANVTCPALKIPNLQPYDTELYIKDSVNILQPGKLQDILPAATTLTADTDSLPDIIAAAAGHQSITTLITKGTSGITRGQIMPLDDIPCLSSLTVIISYLDCINLIAPSIWISTKLTSLTIADRQRPMLANLLSYLGSGPVATSLTDITIQGAAPFTEVMLEPLLEGFPVLRKVCVPVWSGRGMSARQLERWEQKVVDMFARRCLAQVELTDVGSFSFIAKAAAEGVALV